MATRDRRGTPTALLVDLDDTLYDYVPAERRGRDAALALVAEDLHLPRAVVEPLYDAARKAVKARLGDRGAAHARLLYLLEVAHAAGRGASVSRVRTWEQRFWSAYLEGLTLRSGARALLEGFRRKGGRVAVVTDLTVEIQLEKLAVLGLFDVVDALAVSEEVPSDKPASAIFDLAIARLGVNRADCVMVGDNDAKDGAGARALGIPFYLCQSSEREGGMSLAEIAGALGVSDA